MGLEQGQSIDTTDKGQVDVRQKETKHNVASLLWDTFNKPPEERRLLFKVDAALLTFASLGYFCKSLDQVNINNAFVSGMKEDLGLYQNQLNYIQAAWAVGYMVGQLPSNIILTRTLPRYWIASLEVSWCIFTFLSTRCNSVTWFYVLRFFIGLAESGYYPGIQYILGSWYGRGELGKRTCILQICTAIGTMFSGFLMAAVYHLDGKGGYKGWQWVFLINGIIALPVALSGFFIIPDVPEICQARYLSKQEIEIARNRMKMEGREPRKPYTVAKLKKIFSSWHIYLLTTVYVFYANSIASTQPIFQQYLQDSESPRYTISQINDYPTATSAVQIFSTFIYAWLSDSVFKGSRWPFLVTGGIINIICYSSLAVWDIPVGWKWASFILAGASYGLSGLCMAWANEICSDDSEERAITIAAMNEIAYIFQIWLPLIVWRQTDAPRYHIGYVTSTFISIFLVITAFIVRFLHNRERRKVSQNHIIDITATELDIQRGQDQEDARALIEKGNEMITAPKRTSSLSSPDTISMESRSLHSQK